MLCNSAVETMVMANQGSDGNIPPPSVLKNLQSADDTLKAYELEKTVSISDPLLSPEQM